jgi:hypothetical protein
MFLELYSCIGICPYSTGNVQSFVSHTHTHTHTRLHVSHTKVVLFKILVWNFSWNSQSYVCWITHQNVSRSMTTCYHIHWKFCGITEKKVMVFIWWVVWKIVSAALKHITCSWIRTAFVNKSGLCFKLYQKHSIFCVITKRNVTLKSLALIVCIHIITWSISTKLTP